MAPRRNMTIELNFPHARQKRIIHITQRDTRLIKEIRSVNSKNDQRRRCHTRALIALATIACLLISAAAIAIAVVFTRNTSSNPVNNDSTISSSSTSSATTSTITTSSTATSTSTIATSLTTTSAISVSASVSSPGNAWFNTEQVDISCSSNLINLTAIIIVQKTVNAAYSNMYTTASNSWINGNYIDNGTAIIYTWTIVNGQTIPSGNCPFTLAAQFTLHGTAQPTSGDTYEVTTQTSTGIITTSSGHF